MHAKAEQLQPLPGLMLFKPIAASGQTKQIRPDNVYWDKWQLTLSLNTAVVLLLGKLRQGLPAVVMHAQTDPFCDPFYWNEGCGNHTVSANCRLPSQCSYGGAGLQTYVIHMVIYPFPFFASLV